MQKKPKTVSSFGSAKHNPLVDIEVLLAEALGENALLHGSGQELERDAADEATINAALDRIVSESKNCRRPRAPIEQMVDRSTGFQAVIDFWHELDGKL